MKWRRTGRPSNFSSVLRLQLLFRSLWVNIVHWEKQHFIMVSSGSWYSHTQDAQLHPPALKTSKSQLLYWQHPRSLGEGQNGPGRDKAPSFQPSHPTEQYKKHPIKVATCFDRAENVSQRSQRRRRYHGRLTAYSASAPSLTFTINTQQIKPLRPKTVKALHSTKKKKSHIYFRNV